MLLLFKVIDAGLGMPGDGPASPRALGVGQEADMTSVYRLTLYPGKNSDVTSVHQMMRYEVYSVIDT